MTLFTLQLTRKPYLHELVLPAMSATMRMLPGIARVVRYIKSANTNNICMVFPVYKEGFTHPQMFFVYTRIPELPATANHQLAQAVKHHGLKYHRHQVLYVDNQELNPLLVDSQAVANLDL